MKKIIYIAIIIILAIIIYNNKNTTKEKLNIEIEQTPAYIYEYYVYGNHLNIKGKIANKEYQSITLSLISDKEIEIPLTIEEETEEIHFYISDKINNGLYLDNLEEKAHYLFLKIIDKDNNTKYYKLDNNTSYPNLTYYTLSKYNNKIVISTDNEYNTFLLNVENNNDEDIYDITIDAGHGGLDSGAISQNTKEKTITLQVALALKEKLEEYGYKVAITRDKDIDLEEYNVNNKIGRVVLPHENNSKYLFSIHLNSHSKKTMHGVEILTPPNIDYTFSTSLADNIVKETNITYSNNMSFKVKNGVYTRIVDEEELLSRIDNPYDITIGAAYYYMLRETGGYITGSYVDGREEDVGINPYYNSNKGIESYIIELGYIIDNDDLSEIINNQENYVNVIAKTINNELETEN